MPRIALAIVVAFVLAGALQAQSSGPGVPRYIPTSGVLLDPAGKPLSGPVRVTFSVYAGAADEVPLWSETLRVQVTAGRYEALIGSSSPEGIPSTVFASGDARWVGVSADKAITPPRSLLVSVPYALTSDDAAKLGGFPASAFILKDERVASNASPGSPSGWKQAIEEEAAIRGADDTKLQNDLETAETELNTKIDATKTDIDSKLAAETTARETRDTELDTKIEAEKSIRESADAELHKKVDDSKLELHTKVDLTKTELNTKIDQTKAELDGKIQLEKSSTDNKLLLLKQELTNDSTQKVTELEQKKTSKEEFELEKARKQLDIDDIKQKKLDGALFDKHKAGFDFDISDLKTKKLERAEFFAEKALKESQLALKLDKSLFESEKATLLDKIDAEKTRIDGEKSRVDTLFAFTVTFARDVNGDAPEGSKMCPGQTVAIGIVGDSADALRTASPYCSPVNGATINAAGVLAAELGGPFAVPGLSTMTPDYELMCPAGHAVAGVATSEDGRMSAVCRRLFSGEQIHSDASVGVGSHVAMSCPEGKSVAGLDLAGGFAVVCR